MNKKNPIIQIKDLNKWYGTDNNKYHALKNISVTIYENEFVAIIGPSGSGKSTFMNIVGCLDTYDSGTYLLNGTDVSTLNDKQLAHFRGKTIGFIFQSFNLINRYTILDNVLLPGLYIKIPNAKEKALELLKKVGLAKKSHRTPLELSGGERQRVAIARALLTDPNIILADEPTGNLDSKTGQKVMEMLTSFHKEGRTIVLITHDMDIANHAQRIVKIKDGEIIYE